MGGRDLLGGAIWGCQAGGAPVLVDPAAAHQNKGRCLITFQHCLQQHCSGGFRPHIAIRTAAEGLAPALKATAQLTSQRDQQDA